jgi:LAS superfamily LD-carboxypeptidase LdcB
MELKPIDAQGHQLEEKAADAWLRLKAAAEAEGFGVVVHSATRDAEKQKELFGAYVKAMAMWMRTGSVPEKKPKPVAKPNTSEHERGIAVDTDVTDPKFLQWLKLNSTTYGFYFSALREFWHLGHYADGPPPHLLERHISNLRG